jgi:hypothetical protein
MSCQPRAMIVSIGHPFTARQGIALQCSREGGNAPELLFAAAGFIRGRQTQRHAKGVLSARRCKLAAIAELMTITNAGDDCRGGHHADARYSRSGLPLTALKRHSNIPTFAQRRERRNWLFQLPKAGGRSRHGEPVRTRQKTVPRNRRLSFAVAPASLAFPGKWGSSRCHI